MSTNKKVSINIDIDPDFAMVAKRAAEYLREMQDAEGIVYDLIANGEAFVRYTRMQDSTHKNPRVAQTVYKLIAPSIDLI